MTNQQFSIEFDILYNNIMSNQAPGLDEYEKSVFLTKAQDEIVKNYFNAKGNKYQEGFDDSKKRQIDFSTLVTLVNPDKATNIVVKMDNNSTLYDLSNLDILFIINETASIISKGITRTISIIPINYNDYTRLTSKPYKYPLKNQGWRLLQQSLGSMVAEIIVDPIYTLSDYKIRYIKRPKAIMLYKDENLGIEESECELNEEIHPEILQRAVELAKMSFQGDAKSNIEVGVRSE